MISIDKNYVIETLNGPWTLERAHLYVLFPCLQ